MEWLSEGGEDSIYNTVGIKYKLLSKVACFKSTGRCFKITEKTSAISTKRQGVESINTKSNVKELTFYEGSISC
ncbi:hypothetical protein [Bacillus thuringiensis]|uniref:hypothetical protein n=1 Tax=Bacillus thuringiensis TaxID=1428 RepID=UPI002155E504|nr:hypothetical protein [Bacillus thuringiensis]MDA2274040.1 hypothetical protein [Bacillus cereus]